MTRTRIPLDSDALRANVAGTAQEVTIPPRYLPLLEAVVGYHGVQEPLRETLTEYFHGFRNAGAVIDGLQTTLLRNWSYFERSPDRARLFSLLAGLAVDLLDAPLSDEQASTLASPGTHVERRGHSRRPRTRVRRRAALDGRGPGGSFRPMDAPLPRARPAAARPR